MPLASGDEADVAEDTADTAADTTDAFETLDAFDVTDTAVFDAGPDAAPPA